MSRAGRRRYLTHPQFQLRLVGYSLFLTFMIIAIFYASNLYFIWKFIEIGRSMQIPPDHPFFRFLMEQRRTMNSIFAITAVVAFAIIPFLGLLFSHRVAGALYKLESHIDRVAETGELRDVQFRKGDYFPELAESFNRMMAALGKRKE
jgi:methyl-accepting chemotaxis protein